MKVPWIARVAGLLLLVASVGASCLAETLIDADFSRGGFAALGWQGEGDWDIFTLPRPIRPQPRSAWPVSRPTSPTAR